MDCVRDVIASALLWCLMTSVVRTRACSTSMTDGPYTADCHSRGYSEMPEGIPTDINALDFRNNTLTVLRDKQFQMFVNLHRLDLSQNHIQTIEHEAFLGMDHLITLELGGNRLGSVPYNVFHHTGNLVTLNLNNNPLKSIENYAFPGLPKLEVLHLANCQLENIAPKAFLGLNKLADLSLANNNLRYMDSEIETTLGHSLRYIRLHGNPWHCDCHNHWLKRWLKMSEIRWYVSNEVPICTSPQRLVRKHWPKVDMREFACEPIIMATQSTFEAVEGDIALMSCQIHANPKGEVRWYKDTTLVEFESLYTVHNAIGNDNNFTATLRIRNVTINDTGKYFCEISNRAGQSEAMMLLTLVGKHRKSVWTNFWMIVGIAIAGVLSLILMGVLCYWCGTSNKRKSENLKEAKKRQEHQQADGHYVKKDKIPDDDEIGPICTVKVRQPLYTDSMYRGKYMDDELLDKQQYLTADDWQRSLGGQRNCGLSPTSSERTNATDWVTRLNPEPPGYQDYRRSPATMATMALDSPAKSTFRPDRPYSYYPDLPSDFANTNDNHRSQTVDRRCSPNEPRQTDSRHHQRDTMYPVRPMHYVYDRNQQDERYSMQGTVV